LTTGPTSPTPFYILIDLWGGADSQINTKDTGFASFPYRDTLWVAQHYAYVDETEVFPAEGITFLDGLNDAMTQALPSWHMYQNYIDPTLSREEAQARYYTPEVLARLQQIKTAYDPDNVFANPQSV
jgi:FAD/FMN-containing dehydrogenase